MSPAQTKARATELANELLRSAGLAERGWYFKVNTRLRSTLGRCTRYNDDSKAPHVEVAGWLIKSGDWDQVNDTVRHEVAHACALEFDNARGHGKKWKEWAVVCGAKPERCAPRDAWEEHAPAAKKGPKWKGECPDCGTVWTRKRLARKYRHTHLGGNRYRGRGMCPDCRQYIHWTELR